MKAVTNVFHVMALVMLVARTAVDISIGDIHAAVGFGIAAMWCLCSFVERNRW